MSTTSRACPVCHSGNDQAQLFLTKNIDPARLSGFSFASRKTPEYMCHHLVRCEVCELVYADQPPSENELAQAYHVAEYDSSEEADDAARAYARAIAPILQRLPQRVSALEIGTGTGVFLEHLRRAGFEQAIGVEPSAAAIAAAPAHRQPWIREAMFDPKDYAPASFDLICCFMTMEHVRDPLPLAQAAAQLLRPGGAFVTVTHDWQAGVNRLLGKRSPIIDIEHLQLFSRSSLKRMFAEAGYADFGARPFANRYALRYWARLAPLPGLLKTPVNAVLATGLGSVKLSFNVGNLIAHGFRP
jgi:SAM-dependent methyltransferase